MIDVKELGHKAKNLSKDKTFMDVMEDVRKAQIKVFLDPHSTAELREEAHSIVRALKKIDSHILFLMNEAAVEIKNDR